MRGYRREIFIKYNAPSVASFDATRIMLKPLEILCSPINPDITVDVYDFHVCTYEKNKIARL